MPRRTVPFEPGRYYHLYNRGNNRSRIFFESDNYLFFLRKVRQYLDPVLDIVAYCLIPTHYHFLVRVKEREVNQEAKRETSEVCLSEKSPISAALCRAARSSPVCDRDVGMHRKGHSVVLDVILYDWPDVRTDRFDHFRTGRVVQFRFWDNRRSGKKRQRDETIGFGKLNGMGLLRDLHSIEPGIHEEGPQFGLISEGERRGQGLDGSAEVLGLGL